MCVCVCVCVPTDASPGFSTYNKETQKAVNLVSAMAIPWPVPHPITTLLSTSLLTSLKVLSKAQQPLMRLPCYSRVVTTSLELTTRIMVFSKFAPSSFSLTTILYCAVIYWWVCIVLACACGYVYLYMSALLDLFYFSLFFFFKHGTRESRWLPFFFLGTLSSQLQAQCNLRLKYANWQRKSKLGNRFHQFDRI